MNVISSVGFNKVLMTKATCIIEALLQADDGFCLISMQIYLVVT